jgi:copper(I)-binding protein
VIRSSHGAGERRAKPPRRFFVAAVAALIPALAGCEAGANAPTQEWHPPTNGAGTEVHGIDIRNVFVLGASLNSSLVAGQSAGLFLALYNTGSADRLLSISAPGIATSVRLPGGTVSLARGKEILLSGPQPKVVLTGLTRGLPGGSFIRVVMDFQNAGRVTLSVPVLERAQYYSTFSPAPRPSPSPSPKAKRTGKATASPGATPAPGSSATPTPSPSASA